MLAINKLSAGGEVVSLVITLTENGLSDVASEMIVNGITPADSIALLIFLRNWTTAHNKQNSLYMCTYTTIMYLCTKMRVTSYFITKLCNMLLFSIVLMQLVCNILLLPIVHFN